jgi:glycosyltransferase involved in cell wall biosynthesis
MRALLAGGAEKYASDMVEVLDSGQIGEPLIVVTDQSESEAESVKDLAVLQHLWRQDIIFLPDHLRENFAPDATMVARLIHALGPELVLIVNSDSALDAVRRYGLGLSSGARIHCCFFSLAPGSPGSRYAHGVAPFATMITDNLRTAEEFERRFQHVALDRAACVPPKVSADSAVFAKRLARRLGGKPPGRRPGARWLWISRIERQKGTEILANLAERRPNEEFHVFGPVEDEVALMRIQRKNVFLRGISTDLAREDFSGFAGFLFTSLVEGMPNVVLEMAAHAVPIITADVGGLRETFDDESVLFVEHGHDHTMTGERFVEQMDRLLVLGRDELADRLTSAHSQLSARHSVQVFSLEFSKLLRKGCP